MLSLHKRIITTILIASTSAAFLLFAAGCGPKAPVKAVSENTPTSEQPKAAAKPEKAPEKQPAPQDTGPKLQLSQEGVTLNWIEKGQLRMSATAHEGQINEISRVGSLQSFSAKMYENGKLTTTMVAPKVLADTVRRVVTATGGVTLKSLDRRTTVTAQWIKWYARAGKIVGNGGVKINSEMGTMTGAAFVADTALKTLTVKDSAKGLEF